MDHHENPIFKHLDRAQLDDFIAACEDVHFSAGSEIIARGSNGESVYFLVEGQLSVRIAGNLHEQELARLEPPAVVGEMSMLTGHPRSASVVALTSVRLLAMPIETFQARLAAGDVPTMKIVCNMSKVLAYRLAELTEKLMELETVVPQERSVELQHFRAQLFSDWST